VNVIVIQWAAEPCSSTGPIPTIAGEKKPKTTQHKITSIQEQWLLTDASGFLMKLDKDAFSTRWLLIPMNVTYVFKHSSAAMSFVIFSSEGKQKPLDFKNLRHANRIIIPFNFPHLSA